MFSRRLTIFAMLAASLCFAVASPAAAQTTPAPAVQPNPAAEAFVGDLSKQAIKVMTSPGIPDDQRREDFRKLFMAAVDLPVIGKMVLARYWKVATPDQQQEFLKLFEDMLVLTWSNRFKDAGNNITVKVDGTRPDTTDQGVLVDSRILRDKGEPVPVVWRLRPAGDTFRIIDLMIEGTSMVFTYREEYASVINQTGGNVDGLLNAMRRKIDQILHSPQQ